MKLVLFSLISYFFLLGIFFSFPFIENNYTVDENGFKHYVLTTEKNYSTLDIITKSPARYNRELTVDFDQLNSFLSLFLLFLLLFLFYERRWFFTIQTSNETKFNTNIIQLFLRKKNLENQWINYELELKEFLRIYSTLKSKPLTFSSNLLHFQAQISHQIKKSSWFKKNILVFSFSIFLLIFTLTDFAYGAVTFTTNDDADSAMLSTQTGEISFTTGTDNSNAILVVGIGADETTITGVDSITWGTGAGCTGTPQSFTQDGTPLENGDSHSEIWYLVAPTQSATARNVCVDWGSGDVPGDWAFNVAMFENVDQTTPFSAANTVTGTTSPMTGTVNVATGEMGYQVSTLITNGVATPNAGDTELLQITTGGQTKQTIFISYDSTVATPSTLGSTISKIGAWTMKLVALAEASTAKPPILVTDTPAVSDSASIVESHLITASDVPVISDSASVIKTYLESVSDTPTISDSASIVESHLITASDVPVITDSGNIAGMLVITVTDTPVITDSGNIAGMLVITATDTPVITDSGNIAGMLVITATDTPIIYDSSNLGGIIQIADGTSVSTQISAGITATFQYPETEETTNGTITLNVILPSGIAGTITVTTVVEDNIESGLNLATAVDITGPCTDTCTIKFTVPNSILTAASLTSESASIFHDTNGNKIMELNELIATTRDTTSIPGSTIFTASANSTSMFGVGGGSGSESEEVLGSSCDDCTPPTLGVDSSGKRFVSNGFSYNDNPVDVEFYFTPYPLITTLIGANNTAVFKIYENSGPENIRHFELAFGLADAQGISLNQAKIEWDKTWDNIESITITDPENVFDDVIIDTDIGKCLPDSNDSSCLIITIFHTFRAPLEGNIVGTNVWDHKRNVWQNYFNEGVQIEGDSINPPKQHVGIYKGHFYHLIETSKTTSIDEFGDNWTLQLGLWKKEYIPNFEPNRKVIELSKKMEEQSLIAKDLMSQICPKCYDTPFDKINNTFSHKLPIMYSKSLDDPEVQKRLQIEMDRAYEFLLKNYNWYKQFD